MKTALPILREEISFSIDRSKYYYASIKNFICEQICVKVVNNIESSYKN